MITDFSILYIEDDKLTQKIVVSVLERYFSKIYLAKDGIEGLESYACIKPDIVISDISMPHLNGIAMISEIKKINPNQKVLLFTGYNELEYLQDAINIGVDKYILKPLNTSKMLLALSDILQSLKKEKEQLHYRKKLEFVAQHDELTGLLNRRYFFSLLEKLLQQSDREEKMVAILALDLNKFKLINDTYGHEAGDMVLKRVAKNLIEATRKGDIVARFGGDEFAIAIGFLKENNKILKFLERIAKKFKEPLSYVDSDGLTHSIDIGYSIGITFHSLKNGFPNMDLLMKQADRAMYGAKVSNRSYAFFDEKEESKFKIKLKKRQEIEEALCEGEFMVYYQPIIDIKRQTIVAYEALLRWQHPKDGLLTPDKFLPYILDEREMIMFLGSWIIEQVFLQHILWLDEGFDIPLSINISYNELLSKDFIPIVKNLLAQYPRVKAKQIYFEVIEKLALEDMKLEYSTLEALKELGFKIAIDNFGTGISTIATIKSFNVDSIKIDKSFVMKMLESEEAYSIVDASVKLAKAFGHLVVAEGVERKEDLSVLLKLGCDRAQGFAIGKPIPADEIVHDLRT